MKLPFPISISEIATSINAELIGDHTLIATGINEIHKVEPGDITFVDVKKYFDKSLNSAATFIILNERVAPPPGKALLLHPKPFEAYNNLALRFRPYSTLKSPISQDAIIHPTAIIEPGVVIANNVTIGEHTHIAANAVISEHTHIGKNCLIGAGALIGTDAFYFKKYETGYKKWRSAGRVIIQDNVDIAAGCTINKGVSGDTIIGEGTKIDCQVHIGHGVVIGKNCLIAAQTAIAGKVIIEDDVVIYGQVGVAQNIRIGAKAILLAKTGVSKDLAGNITYYGTPAQEVREAYKELATLRQLKNKK